MGIIAINNTEANNRIDDTNNRAGILAKGFKSVGRVAGTMGKAIVTGVGAGAVAVGALMKSSTQAFAEYEQLWGGAQVLYKEGSDRIKGYADEAFKNAGMSANDYLSTANSWAGTLSKSLKGDTVAAADAANMAITDMADNANRQGTDITRLKDAYASFARGEFKLLDNLGLGYQGSRKEMQKLLKDAQKIKKAQGENVKYSINSFADIIEAIHVVQEEMGITGATAEEASGTITGSMAAAGAAWENLMIGIASGNQDLTQLIGNFVEYGTHVVRNVTKLLPNMVQGVRDLINGIAPEIPGIVQEIFPALLDGAIALIGGLAQALPGLLAVLGDTLSNVWANNVWPAIQDAFKIWFGVELPDWSVIGPQLEEGVSGIMENLGNAGKNAGSFFSDLVTALESVGTWVSQNQPLVTGFLGAVAIALLAINAPLTLMGIALLLVAANWDTIKAAIDTAMKAVDDFFNKKIPEWWESTVVQPVKEAWKGVKTWVDNTITSVGNFFTQTIPAGFNQFIQGIVDAWNKVTSAIGGAIASIQTFFGLQAGGSVSTGFETMSSTANALVQNPKGTLEKAYHGGSVLQQMMRQAIGIDGSHASGLNYVPYDNYVANLHKGEAVLTRAEADMWRGGGNNAQSIAALAGRMEELVDNLPDMLVAAFASMKFDVNNREFARLVKAVT